MHQNTTAAVTGTATLPGALHVALENANPTGSKSKQILFNVAAVSTALVLGTSFSLTQALHRHGSGVTFQVSAGTGLAFLIGGVSGYYYWRLISVSSNATRGPSMLFGMSMRLFLLVSAVTFLYPIRFLPLENLPEVFKGLALAIIALSSGGFMLSRMKRFLDHDSDQHTRG